MTVQQPDGAILSIGTGALKDVAFSPDGTTLYATRNGTVTAYSVATGAVSGSWSLGNQLGGIDVSADGRYLVATEQQAGPTKSSGFDSTTDYFIYRLDLTTGTSTTHTLPQKGPYSSSFGDAAFLPDGTALLASNGQWTPLTVYNFETGASTTTSKTFEASTLTSSADHSRILVSMLGISDAPLYIYTAGSGITASHELYADNIMGYNSGVQAISPSGDLIAEGVSLAIYDKDLHLITKLADRYPFAGNVAGLAFSPDGSKLYVLDSQASEVFALSTANWDVLGGYPVGASVIGGYSGSSPSTRYGDTLLVSPDGSHLSVIGTVSLQVIDLGKAVSDSATTGDDVVIGDSANNALYGFEGNDTLDGKAGNDTLYGGPGNDTYFVDNPSDYGFEGPGAGNDTVFSSVSYSIPGYVEKLVLTGADAISAYGNELTNTLVGNDSENTLLGNGGDDVLTGNGGNDTLDGGQGNDRMFGGAGDDTYYVDSPADVVTEAAGAGIDTVMTDLSYTLGENVEGLTLLGYNQPLRAVGNGLENSITGNHGDNLIMGLGGSDTLTGGEGRDTFQGTGADLAGDRITDLSAGDRIAVTDADPASFSYTRVGSVLSLGVGQSVTLQDGFTGRLVVEKAAQGVILGVAARDGQLGDFTGDGRSDILWGRAGSISSWTVDGQGIHQNSFFANADPSWHVVETFDFNGDGRSDVLWRNDNGAIAVWNAETGGFAQSSYFHGPVGTEWRIAATGDIDGDGKDDLLWRKADGAISIWTATGTGFAENSYFHGPVGVAWSVAGMGDLNGDGRDDIVWRNTDGTVSTWTAGYQGFAENRFTTGVAPSWHIAGIADLNGDGQDDLVWRNDNGAVSTWQSTGQGFTQGVFNGSVDTSWQIAQLGDFNNDGRADILWHHDGGAVSVWQSNGQGFDQNTFYGAGPSTDWQVLAHDYIM